MTKITQPIVHWQCKPFHELTLTEWYTISQAREQVFVVEQNCPYLDSDGQDEQAWHILGLIDGELACYARILPPALYFSQGKFANIAMPSIGRVLTVADYRGKGLASDLMQVAIAQTLKKFSTSDKFMPTYISAQAYLLAFYQRLGFVTQGVPYLEDNIPHQAMIKL